MRKDRGMMTMLLPLLLMTRFEPVTHGKYSKL